MEAVIVAGGFGTRLRPLTERHPKPLLPVANLPFLVHQLARLVEVGVDHAVLATSYRADDFEAVLGDGGELGLRLSYVTEAEPLGTGGGLRNAADRLDPAAGGPVVVLNGDQLSGHDLAAQLDGFEAAGADVSLQLVEVPDARAYGCVPTDADGRVSAFREKSPDPETRQVNAGCYVFSREALAAIPSGRVVSLERDTFPQMLLAGRRLVGYRDVGYWIDVGTPAALVQASADLVRGLVRSPALPGQSAGARVDRAARVHNTAQVAGGSAVGPGAVVGDRAVVEGSVLMAGAVVGAGARVRASVLGPGARVGAGGRLDGAAMGDDSVLGAGGELRRGARLGCGLTVADGDARCAADPPG